jgi:hypothetical protein
MSGGFYDEKVRGVEKLLARNSTGTREVLGVRR